MVIHARTKTSLRSAPPCSPQSSFRIIGEARPRGHLEPLQVIINVEPRQSLPFVGVQLWSEIVCLVENSYPDVDLSRQILVPTCERSPAVRAERARHARIGGHTAPLVGRKSYRRLIERCKCRNGCACDPTAVGTVAIGNFSRHLRRANCRRTAVAPSCDHSRSIVARQCLYSPISPMT